MDKFTTNGLKKEKECTYQNKKNIQDSNNHQKANQQPNFYINFNGNYQEAANHYYKQARNLYITNIVLNGQVLFYQQLKNIIQQKNNLQSKLNKLQKNENTSNQEQKKKRHRRPAQQIQRNHRCPVINCQKSYGSEGSLSQHLKLKHHEYCKLHQNQQIGPSTQPIKNKDQKQKQQLQHND